VLLADLVGYTGEEHCRGPGTPSGGSNKVLFC
jgi:hypothetical protein